MKTRLSPAAADDLDGIVRFLAARSPSAAKGFRTKFADMRRFIGENPGAGRQTDEPAVRYINAGRYPYLVFFEMIGADIVILRIMHGARDPASLPGFADK